MSDEKESNVLGLSRSRPKLGPKPSVISQLLDRTYDGPGRTEPERGEEPPAASGPSPDAASETRTVPSIEQLTALPKPGDPYGEAYSRGAAHMLPTLNLLLGDGTRLGFPYSGRVGGPDLLNSPSGQLIVLRFADVVPMEVSMAGRNLDELFDHLGYHKIAWVRALPPGKMIAGGSVPVVTDISVNRWKPPEK